MAGFIRIEDRCRVERVGRSQVTTNHAMPIDVPVFRAPHHILNRRPST